MEMQHVIIEDREAESMSSKRIAPGVVALLIGIHAWGFGAGDAAAASPFSLAGLPTTVTPGASFTVQLDADLAGDPLIALDSVVQFDATRLSFGGYEIAGTLTEGFVIYESLQDTTVSLLPGGDLLPASTTLLRARFDVLPQAPEGLASIRLRGFAGLDSLTDELPFDFASTLTVTAVPEPAIWLTLGIGMGVVGLMRRRTSDSTPRKTQAR